MIFLIRDRDFQLFRQLFDLRIGGGGDRGGTEIIDHADLGLVFPQEAFDRFVDAVGIDGAAQKDDVGFFVQRAFHTLGFHADRVRNGFRQLFGIPPAGIVAHRNIHLISSCLF